MSRLITFIGDVHGKFTQYKRILKAVPNTIQVGDMGVGFRHHGGQRDGSLHGGPPYRYMVESGARFIRGNHDDPEVCSWHSQWIRDGHVEDGMMFIGGATSIDKKFRVEGYSWWAGEENSYQAFKGMLQTYMAVQPHTMVTHDCPQDIAKLILRDHYKHDLEPIGTRTRAAFDIMLLDHKPKLWVFGHWHTSLDVTIGGTRFVCLNELETKELEVG